MEYGHWKALYGSATRKKVTTRISHQGRDGVRDGECVGKVPCEGMQSENTSNGTEVISRENGESLFASMS